VQLEQVEDGIQIFSLAGELDHATAPELREPLEEAIGSGATAVVVDLSACRFIDSTGLGVLVHAHRQLAENGGGGSIAVCCPDPDIRRLLEITGVNRIGLYDTRDEAIAALKS
jgi:anti-anti-sigma factor